MSISKKISDDLTKALKSGDRTRLSVLRMIKSSMKNREIEKKGALTEEEAQAILMSFVKRAKDSIEQFSNAGRTDLAEKEEKELSVVQDYLPKQLGEDDIRKIVGDVISQENVSGPQAMGKVMKASMAKLKGQADGKLVNNIVKEMLEA
jgi:uncharacterized protein YqeY